MEGYPEIKGIKTELIRRLKNNEDSLVERKPPNCNDRELRKELVAFANSVHENDSGVVFLGVSDSGELLGVENTDSKQKKIRKIAEIDCYPPINTQSYVLEIKEKLILAIVIPYSLKKPHFSGPAYVRKGAECVNATETEYEELINSRSDKCREISKYKNGLFSVVTERKKLGNYKILGSGRWKHECRLISCNQHFIRLRDISLDEIFSEPLENVTILHDDKMNRPMLLIQAR